MNEEPAPQPTTTAEPPPAPSNQGCSCSSQPILPDQFVYALGKIDLKFPSLGIEREFQQREMQLPKYKGEPLSRNQRIRRVLENNHHLGPRVCYLFTISGLPAYILSPPNWSLRESMLEAIERSGDPNCWSVLIGRRAPATSPMTCGGILAPVVACDQLYTFSLNEWQSLLEVKLKAALQTRKVEAGVFNQASREVFERIASSTENLGVSDPHRALNYLLMHHSGLFLAAAERAKTQILDRIETREIQGLGSRRVVAVILTFLDIVSGVPERLFCRVDVTEEWPFVADSSDGGRSPLGMLPFIENSVWGMPY